MKKLFIFALLNLTFSVSAQTDEAIKLSGQIHFRTEFDGRDFNNKTYAPNYNILRTRVGLSKNFGDVLNVFVQFQDSRNFGEAMTSLGYIKNLDLSQAYFMINQPFNLPLSVQTGRFRLIYGTQRFLGANDWGLIGRHYDGARISVKLGKSKADIFGATVASMVKTMNPSPNGYPFEAAPDENHSLYGIYTSTSLSEKTLLDIFAYYELNRKKTNGTDANLDLLTAGFSYSNTFGKIGLTTEFGYQTGKSAANDVSAFVLSVTGSYKASETASLFANFDWYSGTEPGGTKINTYINSFSTGHLVLGYMDYFGGIAASTMNLGVKDINIGTDIFLNNTGLKLNAAMHHFLSDKSSSSGENVFGQELDLTLSYPVVKGSVISLGASLFMPGDLMKSYYKTAQGAREDTAFWSYLMFVTNF
ncbi:MAG: alginate export family protein [Ignavibacteriaceae bacterium]|nr:alginate export family protein [Ignavibacteriaceae bacterium]NUM70525.1 alginate export family protein [Ignavibacteriaceae bacterium]